MTTPALACAAAEIALNRFLRLEPAVLDDCAKLAPRCLALRLTSSSPRDASASPALLDWMLVLEFTASGVRVMGESPRAPDVTVTGTTSALIGALRRATAGGGAQLPQGLTIEGDAELLQRFGAMLTRVGFDPEEWLAPIFGGAVAHRVVGGLRRLFAKGAGNARRVADQGAEYLREETYDLARGRDVGEWMDHVDDARSALDRLEARLKRLEDEDATRR